MQFDLRCSKKATTHGEHEVLLFFIGGRGMRLSAATNIYVKESDWRDAEYSEAYTDEYGVKHNRRLLKPAGIKKPSKLEKIDEQKRKQQLADKLNDLIRAIEKSFIDTPKEKIDKEWLEKVIHDFHFPTAIVEKKKEDEKKKKKQLTFFQVFDLFLAQQGKATENPVIKTARKKPREFKQGTIFKFNALKNHLMAYDKHLTFDSLNFDKLQGFVDYEINDMNLINSTVEKRFSYLNWFLNWASEWGYNSNMAYSNFSLNLEVPDKDVIYLDEEELEAVRTHDFSNKPSLDRVRDVFIFCCYTGLRYSDVENLKRSNIHNNKIYITTIKTSDRLEIDLNKVARGILDKYKDSSFDDNKALPVISNQKMNDALEDMAIACGIDTPIEQTIFQGNERITKTVPKYKLVRTHTARRTFVCKAIRLGISPTIIMKFTGHKDYDTMKKYIGAMDKEKSEAMKLFDN